MLVVVQSRFAATKRASTIVGFFQAYSLGLSVDKRVLERGKC